MEKKKQKRYFALGAYEMDEQMFAKGAYGTIHRCRRKGEKEEKYVVKKIDKSKDGLTTIEAEKNVSNLEKEGAEHLLRAIEMIDTKEAMYIITKYCNMGNLEEYNNGKGVLTIDEVRCIFEMVADALNFLHKNNLGHRDMKCDNVLLHKKPDSNDFTAALTDFGFSTILDEKGVATTILGTMPMMSPELLNYEYTDKSVDIWAIGIMIYRTCFGKYPFATENKMDFKTLVNHGDYVIPKYFIVSAECIHLLERCLQHDHKRRLHASDVLEHPFFRRDVKDLYLCWTKEDVPMSTKRLRSPEEFEKWIPSVMEKLNP